MGKETIGKIKFEYFLSKEHILKKIEPKPVKEKYRSNIDKGTIKIEKLTKKEYYFI